MFLGSELGAQVGWKANREVEHTLLYDRKYAGFHAFCATLNDLVLNTPALFQEDYQPWTASWICTGEQDIFALLRHSRDSHVLLVMNTSAEERENCFPLGGTRELRPLLHSEWIRFGGRISQSESELHLENGWACARLPRFSGFLLEVIY